MPIRDSDGEVVDPRDVLTDDELRQYGEQHNDGRRRPSRPSTMPQSDPSQDPTERSK